MFDWFREKDPSAKHEHSWGKWESAGTVNLYGPGKNAGTAYPIGRIQKQRRKCKTCGFIEYDEQETS